MQHHPKRAYTIGSLIGCECLFKPSILATVKTTYYLICYCVQFSKQIITMLLFNSSCSFYVLVCVRFIYRVACRYLIQLLFRSVFSLSSPFLYFLRCLFLSYVLLLKNSSSGQRTTPRTSHPCNGRGRGRTSSVPGELRTRRCGTVQNPRAVQQNGSERYKSSSR